MMAVADPSAKWQFATSVAALAAIVLKWLRDEWRSYRKRLSDEQHAAEIKAKLEESENHAAIKLEEAKTDSIKAADQGKQEVIQAISGNTKITVASAETAQKAFTEANGFNQKWAEMAEWRADMAAWRATHDVREVQNDARFDRMEAALGLLTEHLSEDIKQKHGRARKAKP